MYGIAILPQADHASPPLIIIPVFVSFAFSGCHCCEEVKDAIELLWIRFFIWATELESGPSSVNTNSGARHNRARDILLDVVLHMELSKHRVRDQIHCNGSVLEH